MGIADFIQDNIWLVMIALASGVMFIWPTVAKLVSRTKEVGVVDAVQLINRKDALIVDVREPGEFKAGHIPNARNIPSGQVASRLKELEKFRNKAVLLTCASGSRSASVSTQLRKEGFGEVYALAGGLAAWQQAGMPTAKD